MDLGTLFAKTGGKKRMPPSSALNSLAAPPDAYGFSGIANIPVRYMQGVALRQEQDAAQGETMRKEADEAVKQMVQLAKTDYEAANGLKDAFVASGNPHAEHLAGWNFTENTGKDDIIKVAGDNGLYLIDEKKARAAGGDQKKMKSAIVGFFPSGKPPTPPDRPFTATKVDEAGNRIAGKFASPDEASAFAKPAPSTDGWTKLKNLFGGGVPTAPPAPAQVAPAAARPQPAQKMPPDAKQAPDGKWYVKRNGQIFEVQQ